jgi:Zn-dependent protease
MRKQIYLIIKRIDGFLPMFFWLLLIFGFDEYAPAIATVLAALLHEVGHLMCLKIVSKRSDVPKARLVGFRISYRDFISYKDDITVALCGPLVNICLGFICFCFVKLANGYFLMLGIINLLTALTNLLPIEGYDGYRILYSLVASKYSLDTANRVLMPVSFFLVCILCFLSLYLIGKIWHGFFIFIVLFFTLIS